MPKAKESTTETLFHHWRKGDAGAGKAMAQRFTDWYYAIAVSRLGESAGERPFRAACSKFSKGIVKVEDPRRLLGWAHTIARKQLHAEGEGNTGRVLDGDLPNAFTRKQSPKQLLLRVRDAMPDKMRLLEHTYRGAEMPEDLSAVLEARYAVKVWLRDNADVPFKITPRDPDPDAAPLPLYEAGRLANEIEDSHFELYMLNAHTVCQDIAEFAHYAIALRGGLGGVSSAPNRPPDRAHATTGEPAPPPPPQVTSAPVSIAPDAAPEPSEPDKVPVQEAPPEAHDNTMVYAGIFVVVVGGILGTLYLLTGANGI